MKNEPACETESSATSGENLETSTTNWIPALIGAGVVLGLWVFTFWSFVWGPDIGLINVGNRGTFGDMFGGLNALFSGFAFAGIIFTIYLQRQELSLQRTELTLTRVELNGQKLEMALQNKTLKIQQFENTFFSMLAALNDVVAEMDVRKANDTKDVIYRGRDSMKFLHGELNGYLKGERRALKDLVKHKEGELTDHYADWWIKRRSKLSHYFRLLYNIIQFINKSESDQTIEDGRKYSRILRAMLSDQEQAIIFYNCLSDVGSGFMKDVKRHKLVKHVPDEFLLDPSHKLQYYPSIFKDAYK